MDERLVVNEHYLNRVVAVAATATVEATEDIVSGNGLKLMAKGARIDARARERLLEHKLRKPLEHSVRVIDGVGSRPIDQVARALLDRHGLLKGVCGRAAAEVLGELRELRLSMPLESLLSIYAAQEAKKLEHAVGIALLSAAIAQDFAAAGGHHLHHLMLAGLLHDIGELYIDPAILQARARLTPEQWKHIAAHPIVGSHVLLGIPGVNPKIAEAVLFHHERLDGFGYPHGARGASLPWAGQVLALAEMLMGLMEADPYPGNHAAVAVKLIPGEFDRRLLDKVASATRLSADPRVADGAAAAVDGSVELASSVADLSARLQRLRAMRPAIEKLVATGSPALKALMTHVIERCERIGMAFSSTGLDLHGPQELRERLAAMDGDVHLEVAIVVRELLWRLRELKRETGLRLERLPRNEVDLIRRLLEPGKEETSDASAAAVS